MKTCELPGCDRPYLASGLCNMHRMRLRQNGSVGEAEPRLHLPQKGKKFCKMCEKTLPLKSFGRKSTKAIHTYCVDCYPEYIKYRNILIKYGLSKKEWDELVVGGCSICGDTHRLSVDHDHMCCPGTKSCGKCVRGLLCMRHNLALGNVRDSINELQNLIKYLEKK